MVRMRPTGSALREARPASPSSPRARAAVALFAAIEMVALPLLLWWGRGGWFTFDDWDLLSQRTVGRAHDLFLPHGDHWSTLPILVYRSMWQLFGIRSYVPYQLLVILLHLAVAALLREVMRRAGCSPFTATIFAGVFVFFGVAADTILVAFFMTFVGSLAFGLVHLLLADHDGPVDRRDLLGLGAGLVGMLFSGVAVTMVAVVGISTLLRRGWRVAALHTLPLGAVYLVWLGIIGTEGNRLPLTRPSVPEIARFVAVGVRAAFSGLGQLPGVGLALAATLLVGLLIAGPAWDRAARHRLAAPLALLAGAVIFLVITGSGRAGSILFVPVGGPENARASRYVYIVVALALPAIAVAGEAIIRRWRVVAPVVLVLPLLGLAGNVEKLAHFHRGNAARASDRAYILNAPRLPLASSLPRSTQPDPFHAPGLTLGWLIDGVRSGRVPAPRPTAAVALATETLKLAVRATDARPGRCVSVRGPTVRILQQGAAISVARGKVSVTYLPPTGPPSRPVEFRRSLLNTLTLGVTAGPLRLVFVPAPAANRLCG